MLETLRSAPHSYAYDIQALKATNEQLVTELRQKDEQERRMTQELLGLSLNQGFVEEQKEEDSDKQQRLLSFISGMLINNAYRPPVNSLFTYP